MPFTLSHAAAVLPALRRDGGGRGRLVPSVLVAGSFAPDATYYAASVMLRLRVWRTVCILPCFLNLATIDTL